MSGDQNEILKYILPLQNKFLKEDDSLREASVTMFTSLLPLKLKSILIFISKSYPLFIKTILNSKESAMIRIACLIAISEIHMEYNNVIIENRDKMIDLFDQLIKDDSTDNDYFIFHILKMINEFNENNIEKIPKKKVKIFLLALLDKYIKMKNPSKVEKDIVTSFELTIEDLEDSEFIKSNIERF